MGGWNGSMLGLKVQKKDEELAAQFLKCIGADPDGEEIYEEIGKLNYGGFRPSVIGPLSGEDILGIEESVEESYSAYQRIIRYRYAECRYEDEDEEDSDADEEDDCFEEAEADADSRLDDLSLLVSKLFEDSSVHFAHEDGNDVNDTYFRYETSLDPSEGQKTVSICFYSYDGGPNKDHSMGDWVKPINAKPLSEKIMRGLIEKVESLGYDELAGKIKKELMNV